MAGKFFTGNTAEAIAQAPAPAAHHPIVQQQRGPTIVHAPPMRGRPDDDGIGAPEPGEGGGRLPRADTFSPLTAGEYDFTGSVNSIIRWSWGTVVQFRVQVGMDGGRELDWQQTPGDKLSGKGLAFWKRTLIDAYAAGGWTWDPDPATGWTGWYDTGRIDAEGKPIRVAPYDTFFVQQAPDGLHVPAMLDFHVSVQAGYEKFYKITSVKLHLVDGEPVQAPMPRKVPEWIAEGHGWRGTPESLNGKANVVALQWDQIPPGHCGMKTRKDIR